MSSESPAPLPVCEPRPLAALGLARRRPAANVGIEIAGIVLLFFLLGSEPAPAINEPHYLARARHFWDPAFCSSDFFLSTRDAHPVFFWAFGWITRWVSLEAAAWIGRFGGWILLAGAWYQLSFRLVPLRGASWLTAALWVTLIQRSHMSGEWLIGGIEGKVVAYGLVVWGLAEWVRQRWNRAWMLAGAGAAFHVLVGGWAVVMMLFASLLGPPQRLARLGRSLPGMAAGGILSLAGLVPALRLNTGVAQPVVQRAEEIYVFDRISHHLLLRDFAPPFVFRHLLLIALFAALWWPLRRQLEFQRLAGVVWGAIVLVLCGALLDVTLGEGAWAARLLRYYWFRASDVFVPLGVSLALGVHFIHGVARHPRAARSGLTLMMLLVAAHVVSTVNDLHWQSVSAADRQGGIRDRRELAAWQDACRWIRAHLPPDALCLTPTDHQTFKWYAQRGEVVTWKDVPQDAASLIEWSVRLSRVRRWLASETRAEADARLASLQRDYGFDYIVMRWPNDVPLPERHVLYKNQRYVVLDALPIGLPPP